MKYLISIIILVVALNVNAQPCDSLFTRSSDKRSGTHNTWIMHTPLQLSSFMKDSVLIDLRLQKMRNRQNTWTIVITPIDRINKCVYQNSKIYFRFQDDSEPGYRSEAANNCEGVYEVDIPVQSLGTSMGGNKLKGMLRNKTLVAISLEHGGKFTEGYLAHEQSEMLRSIINCMLDE